ncbi:MAG: response regulator [Deltaproteobacteria bacterium]|nr:response regulator [Deltaproteobacteria bacterium]
MSSILLVQPDPELSESWREALTGYGHDVLVATGVLSAVARAREGGIDVVVLDSYDGAGGVAELVAELERLPDAPPVVLVSSSPRAPALSVTIGAAGFLMKPCEPADLVAAVHKITNVSVRHRSDEPTSPMRERDE